VWTDLVADANRRKCILNATNDRAMCKLILHVKHKLDELDELLNADSAVFSNTRWKVSVTAVFTQFDFNCTFVYSWRDILLGLCCGLSIYRNGNLNLLGTVELGKLGLDCAVHTLPLDILLVSRQVPTKSWNTTKRHTHTNRYPWIPKRSKLPSLYI